MRKEYADYRENMDLDFSLARIGNYPLSWGDSIRMFFVLEGSIIVGIENEEFKIEEDSIEIINKNEPYYIKTQDPDNLVLIIDINPDFFTRFNDFAEYIHYYTDTLDGSRQKEYKYRKLREYISMLFYEFTGKNEGYEENIEDILLKAMNHLLNNFHYLVYEEKSLKEDDLQLERFTRIIYYLKQNYAQKVSLTEIAEREYLTPQYLSYKIKDTFGQSFNDFLNKIRVEESRKLLLDTDKSISEIALEIGFSHSRYYNKHFLKIHGINPADYREKYKVEFEELERERQIEYLDVELALPYLEKYLYKYKRYANENLISKKRIDLDNDLIGYLDNEIILDIRELNLYDLRNIRYLKETIRELNVRYFYCQEAKVLKEILSYGEMENIEIYGKEDLKSNKYVFLDIREGSRDRSKFFYEQIAKKNHLIVKFKDYEDSSKLGILTKDYLKTPLYFNIKFLSKMGSEVIYKDYDTIVTKSKLGYEILAYNSAKTRNRLSINLHGIRRNYKYVVYSQNDDNGNIFKKIEDLGSPNHLDKIFLEELRMVSSRMEFGYIEKSNIHNFVFNIGPGDSVLIVLR